MDADRIGFPTAYGENTMIFVTGPLYSGKKDYIKDRFGWTDQQLAAHAVWDVQELAAAQEDLENLADRLTEYDVVIATEVGGGVVPTERSVRDARERAGRLSCILAERADQVVRVFCGLPMTLKGDKPV